jgi:ATP-dependent DNA helicase RecG
MIFEECERAGLPQPTVTDEMDVVRVTFMRPNLSGHKNDTINDTINGTINDTIKGTEKLIYNRIVSSPGISAVALADEFEKSLRTIMRSLKILVDLNVIEYRGSKKTGGYFSL